MTRWKLEQQIITAAEKWYREVLRNDKALEFYEEDLFSAVFEYRSVINDHAPPTKKVPIADYEEASYYEQEHIPTKPSHAFSIEIGDLTPAKAPKKYYKE